jgi:hypothetical protein
MFAGMHSRLWRIAVLGIAVSLMKENAIIAATQEERLTALEQRLARLEASLEQLIQKISTGNAPAGLNQAKAEAQSLTHEVQSARADPASTQTAVTALPPQEVAASPAPVSSSDSAADEIQNIPYAGYMETHLNHDGINPSTFDFHRFVLLFGHGFGNRIRFWSELEFEHAFVEGREESGEIALEQLIWTSWPIQNSTSAQGCCFLLLESSTSGMNRPASMESSGPLWIRSSFLRRGSDLAAVLSVTWARGSPTRPI